MGSGFEPVIPAFLVQIAPRPPGLRAFRETCKSKMLGFLVVAFAFALSACDISRAPSADMYPWIDTLDTDDGAKPSGKRLMSLGTGLSRIDRTGDSTLLIGVHGYQSEGYEWVLPLQTLDDDTNQVYFFRWDWTRCPSDASAELDPAAAWLVLQELNCPINWLLRDPGQLRPGEDLSEANFPVLAARDQETLVRFQPWADALMEPS